MKKCASLLSLFLVAFLGAGDLEAGQPDMYTFTGSSQGWVGDCADPAFEVWEYVLYEVKGKDYFNKNGEWVKTKWHWTVEGWIFNLDDPFNLALPYKNSVYTEHYDVETDEDRFTGLWAVVTVPGYGSVFLDAGVVTFVGGEIVFEAGKHQWFDGNVDALCEHLAP